MAGGPVPTARSLAPERSPAFRRADAATGREATNPLVGQAARLTDTQGAPGRRLRRLRRARPIRRAGSPRNPCSRAGRPA